MYRVTGVLSPGRSLQTRRGLLSGSSRFGSIRRQRRRGIGRERNIQVPLPTTHCFPEDVFDLAVDAPHLLLRPGLQRRIKLRTESK